MHNIIENITSQSKQEHVYHHNILEGYLLSPIQLSDVCLVSIFSAAGPGCTQKNLTKKEGIKGIKGLHEYSVLMYLHK